MSEFRLRDRSGRVFGPIQEDSIRDLLSAGALEAGTEVSRDGGPFVPVQDFEQIAAPPRWFNLEMALDPEWETINLVRESLIHHLSVVFRNRSYCDAMSMVVSELMENSIKYGAWDRFNSGQIRVCVRSDAGSGALVQVSNPCTPDSPMVSRLSNTVARLGVSGSALEMYQQRIVELARNPRSGPTRSGLGLVRVAYEGGCHLDVTIGDDNYVTVSAMFRVPEGEAGTKASRRPKTPQRAS